MNAELREMTVGNTEHPHAVIVSMDGSCLGWSRPWKCLIVRANGIMTISPWNIGTTDGTISHDHVGDELVFVSHALSVTGSWNICHRCSSRGLWLQLG